jgi:UPF0716 protein FxsA
MPIVMFLLLWPLIEIAGFAWIGGAIGVGPTLAFVVLSAILGLALLRQAGLTTLLELRRRLEAGETPVPAALAGMWRILSGLLLVVPGFFSSAFGVLLLLPPVRIALTGWLLSRLRAGGGIRIVQFGPQGVRTATSPDPTVIEGEFKELPPERPELSPRR